jgi:hypothetical protein
MNVQFEKLESLCKELRLVVMPAGEIQCRLMEDKSPMDVLVSFLEYQYRQKQNQAATARLRNARFPRVKTFYVK